MTISSIQVSPLIFRVFSWVTMLAVLGYGPVATRAMAESDPFKSNQHVRIIHSTSKELVLQIQTGELLHRDMETGEGPFTSIGLRDGSLSRQIGAPALPTYRHLFSMSVGATPTVEVSDVVTEEVALTALGIQHRVMPAQPSYRKDTPPNKVRFHFDPAAYKRNIFTDVEPAVVEARGQMRGVGVGALVISPVQYNPGSGLLRIRRKMTVRITFTKTDPAAAETQPAAYSPFFEPSMRQLLNYSTPVPMADEWPGQPDPTRYPVTYLIVASDQLTGHAKLEEFMEWKRQKGFQVIPHYVAASETPAQIDTWIETQYASLSPKPSFVLIVGDESGTYCVQSEVDPPFGSGGGVSRSDLLYGVIGPTASDNRIPSIHVGRFSVRSLADLDAQVDKTIWYEKNQFFKPTPDLAYLMRPLGAAGYDSTFGTSHGNPQISYGWNHYFVASNGMSNAVHYLHPEASSRDSDIIALVSSGVSIYNYTAHGSQTSFGDPSFSISDINNLTNFCRYPLVIGNCCLTGSFGTDECFGEAWLNAPDRGGIGYIGASMSTLWNEDLVMGVGTISAQNNPSPPLSQTMPGIYDGVMMGSYPSQAGMRHVGLLAVENYGGANVNSYWSSYHVFGDPSLMVYFGLPAVMSVTHAGALPLGHSTFEVSAPGISNALCALYDPESGILYGTGATGGEGNATVLMDSPPTELTDLLLTITAQNCQPYIATVHVAGCSFRLASSEYDVPEDAGNFVVTILREGETNTASYVDLWTQDGTAIAGTDYTAVSGTVDFAVGQASNSVIVDILDDGDDEGGESFTLHLGNHPSNSLLDEPSMAEVYIDDDDGKGDLSFALGAFSATENAGSVTIHVCRRNGSTGPVQVDYSTIEGTASAGIDYLMVTGVLLFADAATSNSFSVPILEDLQDEGSETLTLLLANPAGGAILGTPSNAILTIEDNDTAGTFSLESANYSIDESTPTLAIRIVRAGGSDGAVSVGFHTQNGSALEGVDYMATNGVAAFAHGETSTVFHVRILDDEFVEQPETFRVQIDNPTAGASIEMPDQATVTILSEDGVVWTEMMDNNPGWDVQGAWAFGPPTGGGSENGDPDSGHTGTNVYGYNLAGDYTDDMPQYQLTTPALDCSQYQNVELNFWRWLGVENAQYDHANLEVSNDGTTWTTVWEHVGESFSDSAWQEMTYDISDIADGQESVYLRWGMGPTDGSVTFPGWNIDDVRLLGDRYDDLLILPAGGMDSSGYTGYFFSPSNQMYTLKNCGGTSLSWTAGCTSEWLSIGSANGILAPGDSATTILSLTAAADSLPEDTYVCNVIFSNQLSGSIQTRSAQLVVCEKHDHFTWGPITPTQYVGHSFFVEITAWDVFTNVLLDFSSHVELTGMQPGSASSNWIVGSGSSSWLYPMSTYYHDARTQVIYLQEEIGSACTITSLALYVSTPPGQALENWTIRMRHTSLNEYSESASWESAGWTTVHQGNEPAGTAGWRHFPFSIPFDYNGCDNLMVDFSHNNSSFTSDGLCRYTSTSPAYRSIYHRSDSMEGDPLGWPTNEHNPARYRISNLPDILLGARKAIPLTLTPTNTGCFISGKWSGFVAIDQEAPNVVLRADDGNGHTGESTPFSVNALPSFVDTDGDGVPNWWEELYAYNPGIHDSSAMCSNGMNTMLEAYVAGLHPSDPNARFELSGSGNRLWWDSTPDRVYEVYWTSNLLNGFISLGTNLPSTHTSFTDTVHGASSEGYYKLKVRLP